MILFFNEMELLATLCKLKILDVICNDYTWAASQIKLGEYSGITQLQIRNLSRVQKLVVDDDFPQWPGFSHPTLSIGDASTIYLTLKQKGILVRLSDDDDFLVDVCRAFGVTTIKFDHLIVRNSENEKIVQLYEMLISA